MADELIVHHTVYNRGRDRLQGEPITEDSEEMEDLLSDADSDLNRKKGGFFFKVIGDVFVAGFVTPKADRDGDILYNIFEMDVDVARRSDLARLKDTLQRFCIDLPSSSIRPRIVDPFDESTLVKPKDYEVKGYDTRVITNLWDQLRRDETPVTASLDQVSYFTSKVHGAASEISFVAGAESKADRFDIQQGELPEADPERVNQLYQYIQIVDEKNTNIKFEDLPSLEAQYQRVLQKRIEKELKTLREEFRTDEEIKKQFDEFFEDEVEPRLDEQLQTFLKLQQTRLDPDRSVEDEWSEGSRLNGIVESIRPGETDPIEAELRRETERIVKKIRIELWRSMLDRIENRIKIRAQEMVDRGSDQAEEFRNSEDYKKYERL